ncbi:MAG: sterol-binding protein [Actinobacteria bacterium]|nr:sterol-binding protein [Actinomycetota bacterium]MCB9412935.1 sterol-binding protein [Actinomycetota bacterium]
MASLEECRAALDELANRLTTVDQKRREKTIPDRSLSLHLLDLDEFFVGLLHRGELTGIELGGPHSPKTDIKLSMTSDDLIALTDRQLSFAHAWATGRVRLDASFRDLLRLRSLGR